MSIILDHFYQHLASDVGFTVSLPPVFVEIPQPGTLQLTDLTVPGFDLLVDVTHVVPQRVDVVELELALSALLDLLSLGVISPDVTQEILLGRQRLTALLTGELLVTVMSLDVIYQVRLVLQYLAAVNTEVFPEGVLVKVSLVLGQSVEILEELAALITVDGVGVGVVCSHHVVLQRGVAGEVSPTDLTYEFLYLYPVQEIYPAFSSLL